MNLDILHIDQLLADIQLAESSHMLLSYSGSAKGVVLEKLILDAEVVLQSHVQDKKTRKRAFNVVVEGIQNIERHAIDHPEVGGLAFFALIDSPDKLYLSFGNLVTADIMDELNEELMAIAELPLHELKENYRNQLVGGELSEKGGGGLGLMVMQIKSESPADFNFVELAPGYYFFILRYALTKFRD